MAISPHANRLVLKGGALLAAYDTRRPTRDVDLQARAINADLDHVRRLVAEIAAIAIDDGLMFDGATAQTIREDDQYSGVRVSLTATLSPTLGSACTSMSTSATCPAARGDRHRTGPITSRPAPARKKGTTCELFFRADACPPLLNVEPSASSRCRRSR